ncbi:lipocalin-like domain-containing protein [Nostoc flagelliforme FACHB-838]|uniref:Lipocalin-like domain-containing protein n=1 Tax=Nostoc flagelliforme FACHB-838 TaxID=2692904 RepID=A0ABR8DW58_9NOSO|nr:lipocalin-like domain-containing protein [Nostoc flagelliforme]MBD2533671.1 lipocalin-like domain-containing protein [Nostoc flagelliforme FACHB-838]
MVKNLVGTWKLVSCETRTANGQVFYPLGENPSGYIIYTDNGYVSVAMMRANRPQFQAGDIAAGTVEEKVAAADSYVSYCGTYEIQNNQVVHHVEVSFFPNWVDANQVRYVQLNGDLLTLSTPPILVNGVEIVGSLVWQNVDKIKPEKELVTFHATVH